MKFTKLDKKRVFSPLEKRIAWDSNLFANKGGVICSLCKKEIKSKKDYHLDHIIAHTNAGRTILVNSQVSHRKCNQKKGSK
jgi:5-methylcytosine-specific restriction endonuclease McrA